MNIQKKLDRFAQWSKEKAGAQRATDVDDNFKALELEMSQRHAGMLMLHASMNSHVKHLNRPTEGDPKSKKTPIAHAGWVMSQHSQDFEPTNSFGQCLSTVGQANERIARLQEEYASSATNGWLSSTERSLAQMKEYQNARKRLESRRLAHDTSMGKMQRSKRDDVRAEEEFRTQRAKYEESQEDVSRRMQDIIDMEPESTNDLYSFLEAELEYHDRCREILLQAKQNWPVAIKEGSFPPNRHPAVARSRTNTWSRTGNSSPDELDIIPGPPTWASSRSNLSSTSTPRHELSDYDFQTSSARSVSSGACSTPLSRVSTTDSVSAYRAQLRPVNRSNVLGDQTDDTTSHGRLDGQCGIDSPANSGSANSTSTSRACSYTSFPDRTKKAAPPPPPSRSTKPKPPPPPPMKRSAASSGL